MSPIHGSPGSVSSLDDKYSAPHSLTDPCSIAANPLLVPSPWMSRETTGDLSFVRSAFNPEAVSARLSEGHLGRHNSPECEEHNPSVIPHESSDLDLLS